MLSPDFNAPRHTALDSAGVAEDITPLSRGLLIYAVGGESLWWAGVSGGGGWILRGAVMLWLGQW